MKKQRFFIYFSFTLLPFISQTAFAQFSYVDFVNVREINTGINWGGRVFSLAVNPANNAIVLAATESGGIKKTTNSGRTWRHIENFPSHVPTDIAYTDETGNNIIATTREDFKATNGAGIWRSEDGGDNWVQCPITFTNPASTCNGRMVSWNIAKNRNRIFVATQCGIAISTDGGRSFTNKPVNGIEGPFFSVAVYDNRVIIGGENGLFYSINEGDDFLPASDIRGSINGFHALTWGDNFGAGTRIAYAVSSSSSLYYSTNGGQNWAPITGAPTIAPGACGGTMFVRAVKTSSTIQQLYYGNTCSIYSLTCFQSGGNPYNFNYSGSWVNIPFEHGTDCYQMVFNTTSTPATPYMLGTDGGVEGTTDGGLSWRSIGKASAGLNALQVMDVKGQLMTGSTTNQTVYFGTQDNDLWASNNNAASFPNSTIYEGFNFQMARRATSYTNTRIHYISCAGCGNRISKPLYRDQADWLNVPTPLSSPLFLEEGSFLQYHSSIPGRNQGISITNNAGGSWRNLATLEGALRGEAKLGKTREGYVLYQAVKIGNHADPTNADIPQLVKLNNFNATGTRTPTTSYAAMRNFGSFGVMPTMWPWYEVYGVDYNNPDNIIAADYTNNKMQRSTNGGDDWEPLDALTRMMTNEGRLNFRYSNNTGDGLARFTLASLVSYHPEMWGTVIVGTQEGGVYFSSDNGTNWILIPGTEKITSITSAYWAGSNKIYIGSYGRGLWVINYQIRSLLEELPPLCLKPCFLWVDPRTRAINPLLNEKITTRVIVARGGVITGFRTKANLLTEVMVTTGTQVVFYDKDLKMKPLKIQITEMDKDGNYETAKDLVYEQQKLQKNLQGISINNAGEIGELMFTDKLIERHIAQPVKYTKDLEKQKPDNEGAPIVFLEGGQMVNGTPLIPAGEGAITVTGNFFMADKIPVDIFVDGKLYTTAYTDHSGKFSTSVKGLFGIGSHSIKAVQKTKDGIKEFSNSFRCNNSDKR
jgi:photosystem II stability/assembly factor-like uncharacterized protein